MLAPLGAGCAPAETPSAPEADAPVQFTVRGRWDDPTALRVRIDPEGAPVSADVFRASVLDALEVWNQLEGIGFVEATGDETPQVELSWQRGDHGPCTPFGYDTSVAHTGPIRPMTYVHFDAGRSWSLERSAGTRTLAATVQHELGHVLGLDHSAEPTALMHASPERSASTLTASERAGIASLYGGGEDREDDLHILRMPRLGRSNEAATFPLRRVAPPETTDFTVFDVDGDGADDVVVWRTDPEGHGALSAYHFDGGPQLVRTTGPMFGAVVPGAPALFRIDDDGTRLLIQPLGEDRVSVRGFNLTKRLVPLSEHPFAYDDIADADGDGRLDRAYAPEPAGDPVGDLDGDGTLEVVRRARGE